MSKIKGKKCAALCCGNYGNIHKDLCFFSFPKDKKRYNDINLKKKKNILLNIVNRCNDWALAINRLDLCTKDEISTRICSSLIEETMFTNKLKNRLLNFAVPRLNKSIVQIIFNFQLCNAIN